MKREELMKFAPMPKRSHDLLMAAAHGVEEEKAVKKKISLSLVLALVLIFVAVAAVAATLLWDDYALKVKQTEQEKGDYEKWPAKDKIDLVKALAEMGHIAESDETKLLFDPSIPDADAHRIADKLLMNLTQRKVFDISLIEMTQSIWGSYVTWTPERKAWWQSIENMEREPSPDAIIMVMPEEGDLSEEEAILIAKEATLKAFGLPESYLDGGYQVYTELYVTPARPEYRRWYVQIHEIVKEESINGPSLFSATMDARTGTLIADPDKGSVLPEEQKERYDNKPVFEQFSHPLYAVREKLRDEAVDEGGLEMFELRNRTLEQKAAYSKEVNPIIQAILDSGDLSPVTFDGYVDYSIVAPSTYTYGLPGDNDIPQEQALELAVKAIRETYGLDESIVALYKWVCTYFDISDPEKPLWRFLIQPETWRDFEGGLDNPQYDLRYRVEIDARTGDIVTAEEFQFVLIDWKDRENVLRWY